MNGNTDQFQKDLRANLSLVLTSCDRFIAIVNEMMSATEQELREQLAEINKDVDQSRARIEAARADLNRWMDAENLETSEKVSNWKATRQTDKLHGRADRSERCATTSIEL